MIVMVKSDVRSPQAVDLIFATPAYLRFGFLLAIFGYATEGDVVVRNGFIGKLKLLSLIFF